MAAGKRNIEIITGDDYVHVVTLNTRVGTVLTPIDITGRVYTAQIRKYPTSTTLIASFVCVVTDATGGEITLSMGNLITVDLVPDCYHWDMQQNASGVLNTILRGKAVVITDVTRP